MKNNHDSQRNLFLAYMYWLPVSCWSTLKSQLLIAIFYYLAGFNLMKLIKSRRKSSWLIIAWSVLILGISAFFLFAVKHDENPAGHIAAKFQFNLTQPFGDRIFLLVYSSAWSVGSKGALRGVKFVWRGHFFKWCSAFWSSCQFCLCSISVSQ